jgi:hypothetical protein
LSHTEPTEITERDRRLSHAQSLRSFEAAEVAEERRRRETRLSHTEFTESTEKSKDMRREILESMHVHALNSRGEFFASHRANARVVVENPTYVVCRSAAD